MIKGFFSLRYVFHTSEGVVCAWHSKLKGDYVIDMHMGWWHRTWFCLTPAKLGFTKRPFEVLVVLSALWKGNHGSTG